MRSVAVIRASAAGMLLMGALAGCSERYVTTANETVLVVVDGVRDREPLKTAQVHFTFAKPQPLNETGSEQVVAMKYEAAFDCGQQTWGKSAEHLTTQSGRTISQQSPTVSLEQATPGSLGASVVAAVCDPAARSNSSTGRLLPAIQKDYLKRMGGRPEA